MNRLFYLILLVCTSNLYAKGVAVTDLTYSERVEGYIHIIDYHNKTNVKASSSDAVAIGPYSAVAASKSNIKASEQTDYFEYEQNYSYIEVGELRKFTADIKGEMLKSRNYRLVQAKPVTNIKDEKIYDIINRIKKGYYPGADYVLFGTVSDIQFSNDVYQPQGTGRSMVTQSYTLTLAAEFSLINTKTYQIVAAFTAIGEGSDTKIQSSGSYATPNRAMVVAEVSKTLGKDVIRQLEDQYSNINNEHFENNDHNYDDDDEVNKKQRGGVTVFQ